MVIEGNSVENTLRNMLNSSTTDMVSKLAKAS